MTALFWRALVAFLALPTVVAFVIPGMLRPSNTRFRISALPLAVAGITMLLWCVRDFYITGRGTLAPWAPPKHLVTVGLYRVSRNPMYVAVSLIIAAGALGFRSSTLAYYGAGVAAMFYLRVVVFEEPWLARTFGPAWLAYRARVLRWLGRRSPSREDRFLL